MKFCRLLGITPYRLPYGQDVVLPLEINVSSLRVATQHLLDMDDYQQVILMELESVGDDRPAALRKIELSKIKMDKAYNKRVKRK